MVQTNNEQASGINQAARRVLVVDDDRSIRRVLRAVLSTHAYSVTEAANGREALESMQNDPPDLVILDLGLPDMDGLEVTRQVREWSSTPIIILSVREDESSKVAALDSGADDYLSKPFGTGELLARMRTALRHSSRTADEPLFESGELKIDRARRLVTLAGQPVELTPTEYDLLQALARHAGKVLTHRQLLQKVWGSGYESETHLLQVNISNLRHKIERDPARPQHILTEAGVGYRLRAG